MIYEKIYFGDRVSLSDCKEHNKGSYIVYFAPSYALLCCSETLGRNIEEQHQDAAVEYWYFVKL